MEEILKVISLPNVSLVNVLDILIVAYLFYKFYAIIQDTRAEQLLKGIVLLLIATKVSEWLELWTINWLLTNTLTVGMIALLIIFQPELRRALEKIGSKSFYIRELTSDVKDFYRGKISEIIDAVHNLSNEKIGALIVLERETSLLEIKDTGVTINADLTSNLLQNIFVTNSPLHDGAVIIKDFRISAAGCFLPLSDNQNLSKTLGTRHRAGIGVSEMSDSLVIIVSEETGTISMVRGGKLSRHLDEITLRSLLLNTFIPLEEKKKISIYEMLKKIGGKK